MIDDEFRAHVTDFGYATHTKIGSPDSDPLSKMLDTKNWLNQNFYIPGYDPQYSQLWNKPSGLEMIDMYSFGSLARQITTGESEADIEKSPYFSNPRKRMPMYFRGEDGTGKVVFKSPDLVDIIDACTRKIPAAALASDQPRFGNIRPSAKELLNHPFFDDVRQALPINPISLDELFESSGLIVDNEDEDGVFLKKAPGDQAFDLSESPLFSSTKSSSSKKSISQVTESKIESLHGDAHASSSTMPKLSSTQHGKSVLTLNNESFGEMSNGPKKTEHNGGFSPKLVKKQSNGGNTALDLTAHEQDAINNSPKLRTLPSLFSRNNEELNTMSTVGAITDPMLTSVKPPPIPRRPATFVSQLISLTTPHIENTSERKLGM